MFRDIKPAFGQTNPTPAFGGSGFNTGTSASPFAQTFGKNTTAGFTAPAFGSTGPSLFGSTAPSTGGLFGGATATPVFGQTTTTQSSAFGFPSSTTGSNLFGNQQNANTNLFGSPGTSAFGGANKPAFGGFGSSTGTGLFGQQQQTQAVQPTSSLFGQSTGTTNTGIFGAGGFGASNTAGTPIKFVPVTGTDTMMKNGVSTTINTRHHCITCMKEYESKSLEELRLEDYVANRKGSQQPTQQTGLFGTSTGGSLFGAGASTSTGAGGIFTDNKPLFGGGGGTMGFTSTAGGVFGSTNQTSGGLFGKSGFGTMTTTTGTTGFPFNTTTTANPFGGNTQAKPFGTAAPQTGGLFGATTSQPPTFGTQSTGFTGFGTQPNQSIGLFGQNKPAFNMATTSSGFLFGQNTSTNTGGLFGAKPAGTTGFGTNTFGSTTAPTFGTGSMFGTNQSTSLFNQPFKPAAPGFTQQTPTTSTLGGGLNVGGSSLFGSTANKPGGLFSNNTGMFSGGSFGTGSTFGTGTGLGTSFNLGGNTLLGGTGSSASPSQQGSTSVHQQILALASMPFGDSPLFRNLLPVTGKTDELLKPTSPAAQKAVISNNRFKVSPRENVKVKVKPLGVSSLHKKSLFEGLEEADPTLDTFKPRSSTKRLMLKPKIDSSATNQSETQESDKENKNSTVLPDQAEDSWLRKSLHENTGDSVKQQDTSDPHATRIISPGQRGSDANMDSSTSEPKIQTEAWVSSSAADKDNVSNNSLSSSDDSLEGDEPAALLENQVAHPTGIVLHRAGYYTMPSLEELACLMNDDGTCVVENFTVGREGYGNVFFPDPINVGGLNLDEIVHFRHKEIMLSPDDEKKPPVGVGLNRRAQVTLDRVWPLDKTTHSPITDPERLKQMDYEAKLRHVCAKLKTRFLDYRPQTGSWVFKVDHFSKYGLSDSDEDDLPESDIKKLKQAPSLPQQDKLKQLKPKLPVSDKEVARGLSDEFGRGLVPVLLEDDQDMEEGLRRQLADEELDKMHQSPTVQLAKHIGSPPHKVQLMKASFFMEDEDDLGSDYMELTEYETSRMLYTDYTEELEHDKSVSAIKLQKSFPMFRTQFSAQESSPQRTQLSVKGLEEPEVRPPVEFTSGPWIHPPIVRPKMRVLRHQAEVVPLGESSIGHMSANCVVNMALVFGRSFRAGWGQDCSLVTLNTQSAGTVVPLRGELRDLNTFTSGRALGDRSHCIVQRLRICGGGTHSTAEFTECIEPHLKIQLEHSEMHLEEECPHVVPRLGVDALHAHCAVADELHTRGSDDLLRYNSEVWNLCVALWGNLPDLDADSRSHNTVMLRRQAVSEWLEDVLSNTVKQETATLLENPHDDEHHIPVVLSLLTGRKILDACQQTQQSGDHYMSLMLAQLGSGPAARQYVQQQLVNWQEVEADSFVHRDRMKLLMLVAGIPLFTGTHDTINVCEGLDWKRAFALHLWYMCSPVASITDALLQYEQAFAPENEQNVYAKSPEPSYCSNEEQRVWDMCYHLLKLFSTKSHPLEQLLSPGTHTLDPLDYRLSWLMLQVLLSLGYSHISDYCLALIHVSFASQLESQGLWHWAIFVLLHINNPYNRKAAVLDMLGRHVQLSESEEYLAKVKFVCDKLNIPSQWVYEAKATLATACNRHKDAAYYLIKAGLWNKSHQVIMRHIAADAVVNENYEYLRDLLVELVPTDRSSTVSGWGNEGQLLWDYLRIVAQVDALLAKQDVGFGYQLEKLQPQLSALCARINMLPCPTAMDKLCQSEIAKRTMHVVRNVLMLQKGEYGVSPRVLAHLVSQLPLPEDYALQELRQVVGSCVAESMHL